MIFHPEMCRVLPINSHCPFLSNAVIKLCLRIPVIKRFLVLFNILCYLTSYSSILSACIFQAWRRLQVTSQHMELVKEFPSNFTFIIMQHSPDRFVRFFMRLDSSVGRVIDCNMIGRWFEFIFVLMYTNCIM